MTETMMRGPATETWNPGDLAWVMTGTDAPRSVRDQRCLAVYTHGVGSHDWMLLIPTTRTTDGIQSPTEGGWRLTSNLIQRHIDRLNLQRFTTSHRGWWPGRVEVLERALGYWCATHVCFHAAETCPPETLAEALTRLAVAESRVAVAEQALVEFKDRASTILSEGADSHDLCEVYDEWAVRAGLNPRPRSQDVELLITYRQTVTVRATTYEEAKTQVLALGKDTSWDVELPLVSHDELLQEVGSPYSISVTAD